MAPLIGTVTDICRRMRSVLPTGWFAASDVQKGSVTPILDAILSGLGSAWKQSYDLIKFVRNQTRIATATGSFLDLVCADFFATGLGRLPGELDANFRSRIVANLLIGKGTRAAVMGIVQRLTGVAPLVSEASCGTGIGGLGHGGYGVPGFALGSRNLRFSSLITCVPHGRYSTRQSSATYVDASNRMHLCAMNVVRTIEQADGTSSVLFESRAFNLIKDSIGWTGFALSAECGAPALLPASTGAPYGAAKSVEMVVPGSGALAGPSVTVWVADVVVTGSIWVQIVAGAGLGVLELRLGDATGEATTVPIAGTTGWQRVSASHDRGASGSGPVTMQLAGLAASPGAIIRTQCWQIETGDAATSYIPSDGTGGFRDADSVVALPVLPVIVMDRSTRDEAVCDALPAGTTTWIRDLS